MTEDTSAQLNGSVGVLEEGNNSASETTRSVKRRARPLLDVTNIADVVHMFASESTKYLHETCDDMNGRKFGGYDRQCSSIYAEDQERMNRQNECNGN